MMLQRVMTLLVVVGCVCFSGNAVARTSAEAIEAASVSVTLNLGGSTGNLTVEGCGKCPLKLKFDARTKFLFKGKKIAHKESVAHSGKPGTVIYLPGESRILKVVW